MTEVAAFAVARSRAGPEIWLGTLVLAGLSGLHLSVLAAPLGLPEV